MKDKITDIIFNKLGDSMASKECAEEIFNLIFSRLSASIMFPDGKIKPTTITDISELKGVINTTWGHFRVDQYGVWRSYVSKDITLYLAYKIT